MGTGCGGFEQRRRDRLLVHLFYRRWSRYRLVLLHIRHRTDVDTSAAYCNADTDDWGSGATVNVDIINNGSAPIDGWTLEWAFPGNQQITNLWGGSYTQNGASVAVTNLSWNAIIGANGGSVGFGFNLSYSGSNDVPTSFTLNGVACEGQ